MPIDPETGGFVPQPITQNPGGPLAQAAMIMGTMNVGNVAAQRQRERDIQEYLNRMKALEAEHSYQREAGYSQAMDPNNMPDFTNPDTGEEDPIKKANWISSTAARFANPNQAISMSAMVNQPWRTTNALGNYNKGLGARDRGQADLAMVGIKQQLANNTVVTNFAKMGKTTAQVAVAARDAGAIDDATAQTMMNSSEADKPYDPAAAAHIENEKAQAQYREARANFVTQYEGPLAEARASLARASASSKSGSGTNTKMQMALLKDAEAKWAVAARQVGSLQAKMGQLIGDTAKKAAQDQVADWLKEMQEAQAEIDRIKAGIQNPSPAGKQGTATDQGHANTRANLENIWNSS